MVNVPKNLKEYFDMYYEYNSSYIIPENINVYLLDKEEFQTAIKEKSVEVFRIKTPIIEDTINGIIIVDTKNKYRYTYNIYLLKEYEEVYPYVVSVLFHELSHAHTLPSIEVLDLKEYEKNEEHYSYLGYEFWREFIANYIGDKTFIETCGCINYVSRKEDLEKFALKTLKKVKEENNISQLDELISYILLSNFDITNKLYEILDGIDVANFKLLIKLCKTYLEKNDYIDISKEELDKIGTLISLLF